MTNLHINKSLIKREEKSVIWLTGLSGSGKSTIANALEVFLENLGIKSYVLDGDNIRHGLNKDLGFSDEDRKENMRRIAEVSKLFSKSGTIAITAFISPFDQERDLARKIIGDDKFIEIYLSTPLEVCEKRDVKGLYKKARNKEILNFTGIDSPYEPPLTPSITLNTEELKIQECVDQIIEVLSKILNKDIQE